MFTQDERNEINEARNKWQANARENKVCEVISVNEDGQLVREVFPTVEEANKSHPWVSESRGMRGYIDGKDAWRFESSAAYAILSN